MIDWMGVAIYFTLEHSISSPVEDNKVSLSICETLYKCSKFTIQSCHKGNPIWRYVSNLICCITSLLLFHNQEFHLWTLQSKKPDAFQRKCHWSNRGQAFGRRQKVTVCMLLTSTRFKRVFFLYKKEQIRVMSLLFMRLKICVILFPSLVLFYSFILNMTVPTFCWWISLLTSCMPDLYNPAHCIDIQSTQSKCGLTEIPFYFGCVWRLLSHHIVMKNKPDTQPRYLPILFIQW